MKQLLKRYAKNLPRISKGCQNLSVQGPWNNWADVASANAWLDTENYPSECGLWTSQQTLKTISFYKKNLTSSIQNMWTNFVIWRDGLLIRIVRNGKKQVSNYVCWINNWSTAFNDIDSIFFLLHNIINSSSSCAILFHIFFIIWRLFSLICIISFSCNKKLLIFKYFLFLFSYFYLSFFETFWYGI